MSEYGESNHRVPIAFCFFSFHGNFKQKIAEVCTILHKSSHKFINASAIWEQFNFSSHITTFFLIYGKRSTKTCRPVAKTALFSHNIVFFLSLWKSLIQLYKKPAATTPRALIVYCIFVMRRFFRSSKNIFL